MSDLISRQPASARTRRHMEKPNKDIRTAIREAGLKHWQIAEALKISENTLARRMRHELTLEEKKQILNVIRGTE